MTTLHDRLADAADAAPRGVPDPDLWDRGRRLHRRRRAGTVGIAAATCLMLVALGGVSWWESRPTIEPAAPGTSPALPTQIHEPSAWLPGTAETGPPGRLAALVGADRGGWFGSRPGVVGISAETGEYGFLDLPDDFAAEGTSSWTDTEWALSPDGRRVAYWVTGDTTGLPPEGTTASVAGVAVYDTVSGEVEKYLMATEHGLHGVPLLWVDDALLLFGLGQHRGGKGDPDMDQLSRDASDIFLWEPGVDDPQPVVDGPIFGHEHHVLTSGNGLVVVDDAGKGSIQVVDPRRPSFTRRIVIDVNRGMPGEVVVDDTGTRFAGDWGGDNPRGSKSPNQIFVGTVEPSGGDKVRAEVRVVPGTTRTFNVLRWLDDHRVVAVRGQSFRLRDPGADVVVYDLSWTGKPKAGIRTEIVELPPAFHRVELATDLLSSPTAERPAPPTPLDQRLVTGAGLTIILLAGLSLWSWRRRVRL